MTARQRTNLVVPIGGLLVLAGLVVSGAFLESTIFPAGTIVGTERRAPALALCRLVLVALGTYLIVRKPRVTTVHLAAAAIGGAVAVVVSVVLLQIAYVPPPVVAGWRAFAPPSEQNQLGYRGQAIAYSDDDRVVLLLGDSQVEAMALAFDAMPERRLEAELGASGLKTRVFSIGAGGYGQDQQLLALQEYLSRYRADLVILWQTPGNDLWNNVFKTHMASHNPKPTFWLDRAGQLCGPSEGLGQPLADSPIVAVSVWQRVFGLPWRDKSWERGLPTAYAAADRSDGPVQRAWQERWDHNTGRMRDENLDTEKSHLAVALTPRSERMQYALDLTRALTKRIEDVVVAQGGRLVLFQVAADDSLPETDGTYALNGKFYRVSRQQYEANWQYVNDGFDLERVRTTVKDWRVGPEDGHLNTLATAQVISDLGRRLAPRLTATKSQTVARNGVEHECTGDLRLLSR
jgi:hypothetical protein